MKTVDEVLSESIHDFEVEDALGAVDRIDCVDSLIEEAESDSVTESADLFGVKEETAKDELIRELRERLDEEV